MKNKLTTLLLLLLFTFAAKAQIIEKEHVNQELTIRPNYKNIVGYYTSWEWYKRAGLTAPGNMDFSKYTIINYSFFQTDKEGNLWGTDAWADSILLRGKYDYNDPIQPAYFPNTSLIDLAHVAGAKVMVSIGGWTLSETFPVMASTAKGRANFAHNCVLLLHRYSFDGIDIDWEYPCYAEHKGTPADKENFTLLMKAIRDSIDVYGDKVNQKMLLTAAFGAQDVRNEAIEWDKLKDIMDFFNMMCYDYNGSWSENASFNAPLYAPAVGDTNALDNTFRRLVHKYHVSPKQINLGVAFYGRSLMGKEGTKLDIYGTEHKGCQDTITFVPDLGGSLYWNILLQKDKFEEKWDDKVQNPYLIGKTVNTYLDYDDPRSIKLKAQYVKDKEAAGVIIWEISGDVVEKGVGSGVVASTPLIDALNSVLQTARKKPIPRRWRDPVVKIEKEKGWRAKAIKQNIKNIYKKGETPTSKQ